MLHTVQFFTLTGGLLGVLLPVFPILAQLTCHADVPQPVPGKISNAKRHKAAGVAKSKPAKKLPALTAGAPSTSLSVWSESEMASAVQHLQSCDPGKTIITSRQADVMQAPSAVSVIVSVGKDLM